MLPYWFIFLHLKILSKKYKSRCEIYIDGDILTVLKKDFVLGPSYVGERAVDFSDQVSANMCIIP